MTDSALKILKALEEAGELTLEEIANFLPKKFGDHRDFYAFGSLVSRGYIEDNILRDSSSPQASPAHENEQLLAWKYFAMSTANDRAEYKGHTWMICGGDETLKGQKFALSGIGQLYLSELKTKRYDRAFSIGSGMVIGTIVALFSVLIERYLK